MCVYVYWKDERNGLWKQKRATDQWKSIYWPNCRDLCNKKQRYSIFFAIVWFKNTRKLIGAIEETPWWRRWRWRQRWLRPPPMQLSGIVIVQYCMYPLHEQSKHKQQIELDLKVMVNNKKQNETEGHNAIWSVLCVLSSSVNTCINMRIHTKINRFTNSVVNSARHKQQF